jgi:hypothetical protein
VAIAARTAPAQTVQLPTFNTTTVQTTVSVPDGGTGLLGGVSRLSEGSTERGVPMLSKIPGLNRLFKNRGLGRETGLSNMTVIPRIIIQEEEEWLQTGVSSDTLSDATAYHRSGGARGGVELAPRENPELARRAAFLANNVARRRADLRAGDEAPREPTPEEVRRRAELAKAERASEAEQYLAKAAQAEAEGRFGVAKIYYQMAARRVDGELKDQIAAKLAILAGAKQAPKLAER